MGTLHEDLCTFIIISHSTLHEDLCTFIIISHSFILITRNVSDKSCGGNENTHFACNSLFYFFENLSS